MYSCRGIRAPHLNNIFVDSIPGSMLPDKINTKWLLIQHTRLNPFKKSPEISWKPPTVHTTALKAARQQSSRQQPEIIFFLKRGKISGWILIQGEIISRRKQLHHWKRQAISFRVRREQVREQQRADSRGLFHSRTMTVKGSFRESILACSGGTSSLSFSECTLFSHWGMWPSFRAAVPPAASACRCLATTSSPFILSRPQPRYLSFLFSTHKFVNTSRPTPAPYTLPLADSDITYVQSVESDRHLCSLTPQRPLMSKKGAGGFKKILISVPQTPCLTFEDKLQHTDPRSVLTTDCRSMYSVIVLIC